jgi:hypothetical protein
MDILINELSLEGQFPTVTDFIYKGLNPFITVLDEIAALDYILLKKYDLYNSMITEDKTLHDILIGRISREYDQIRKLKRKLAMLFEEPYWEDDKKHYDYDIYVFNGRKINKSSLAESCERDRVVVSFIHRNFEVLKLQVIKNQEGISIDNLYDKLHFLELMKSRDEIEFEKYIRQRFRGSKLNFAFTSKRSGFGLLNSSEVKNAFLSSFKKFEKMKWDDILKDDGFDYKPYKDQDLFKRKYNDKNICKFRTSQKYRCFGYRENDTFFVIRFESDHKLSDKG